MVLYTIRRTSQMKCYYDGNASKPHISKMYNVQETQKNVSKQTNNIVYATSIFALLVDFAFEFCYQPLTLYRDWYQKHISIKISFSSNMLM